MNETHEAARRQNTPHLGTRPGAARRASDAAEERPHCAALPSRSSSPRCTVVGWRRCRQRHGVLPPPDGAQGGGKKRRRGRRGLRCMCGIITFQARPLMGRGGRKRRGGRRRSFRRPPPPALVALGNLDKIRHMPFVSGSPVLCLGVICSGSRVDTVRASVLVASGLLCFFNVQVDLEPYSTCPLCVLSLVRCLCVACKVQEFWISLGDDFR